MKRSFLITAALSALVISTAGIIGPATPASAIIVFDPTNYAKNLLTAERALQQVNNQIRSLQNEATMLTNEAKNLTTFNFPELQQLTSTLQQINTLMGQAQNISFHIGDLSAQFTRLFPGETSTPSSSTMQALEAKARVDGVLAAYRETMAAQSQIAGNVSADAATLSSLTSRSQNAEGALQVGQATNQLLALTAKQQFQIQQMMATQYRAEATEAATKAQSSIDAQAATARFLGSGSAYTPQ
ncbi:P-type conjugative transfer protein TrbJ [uncultured Sphingomonas sp.]|uniref:P-type conjugative transfer protein TrbJ n=1 Tax=uncultured Sphingomonas sp. TaxID=158754 RepID=UPI002616B164|nr:P-type conjugative transfer protein TrbJ [uncultured Sphingomonas sp.]